MPAEPGMGWWQSSSIRDSHHVSELLIIGAIELHRSGTLRAKAQLGVAGEPVAKHQDPGSTQGLRIGGIDFSWLFTAVYGHPQQARRPNNTEQQGITMPIAPS